MFSKLCETFSMQQRLKNKVNNESLAMYMHLSLHKSLWRLYHPYLAHILGYWNYDIFTSAVTVIIMIYVSELCKSNLK